LVTDVLAALFVLSAFALLGGLLYLLSGLLEGHRPKRTLPADGGGGATLAAAGLLVLLVSAAGPLAASSRVKPVLPALTVEITGFLFGWRVEYSEGQPPRRLGVSLSDRLVLPAGVEVLLTATSTDVIHRLTVPELSLRSDLVPGWVSTFQVRPQRSGHFAFHADELCGSGSGQMAAPLDVLDPAEFRAWLALRREARERPWPQS